MSEPSTPGQRIDKWLWAARFFKTRSQAAQAVSSGKVQVDGKRIKPARVVTPGVSVRIRKGELEWQVTIEAVRQDRRSAAEAQTLYVETPESAELRRTNIERQREARRQRALDPGRPDKKGRRDLIRMKRT